jgi:hypothetical protein
LFVIAINAQFATPNSFGQTLEEMQRKVQYEVQHPHQMPIRGRVSSVKRLHRVENSITKEENRDLKKVHAYHLKINKKLALTIKAINKARDVVVSKGQKIAARLAKYGSRKLAHIIDLYNMAEDFAIKSQLKPIIRAMKNKMMRRERLMKESVDKIINALTVVLTRTMKQLEMAKFISENNNRAAKISLHAIGDNMAQGLKQTEGVKPIGTKDLRMLKHKIVGAQRKITHELHKANVKEMNILKNARGLLKGLRIKTKHVINELKHTTRKEYRNIYRKHSKMIMGVLLRHEDNLENYEY